MTELGVHPARVVRARAQKQRGDRLHPAQLETLAALGVEWVGA
ncbi:hypothetical protein [Streptomyces sp. NPDC101206]